MIIQIKISVQITDPNSTFNKVIIFFLAGIFHSKSKCVRVSHSSKVLKDWEGLPVEKETKIKDYFENKSVLYLTCGMQILK